MQRDIHPLYRTTVLHDARVNAYFNVGSTIQTDREIVLDENPYVRLEVSSASHFHYTGKQKVFINQRNPVRCQQHCGNFFGGKEC